MLSLLKKNPEAAQGSGARPWHPNFRNAATLPDTKVVRTKFFVNAFAGLIAVGLLALVVSQEMEIASLRSDIAALDVQISRDTKPSEDAGKLFTQFQAAEKKVLEADQFVKGNGVVVSEFIRQLGQTVPAVITFSSLSYSSTSVVLRGEVDGAFEQASESIGAYEKQLKADPAVTKHFDQVKLNDLTSGAVGTKMTFQITLSKSAPAKGGRK